MLAIPDLTNLDATFGNIDHMPKYDAVPDEFKHDHNPFVHAVAMWFFKGGKRDGRSIIIDGQAFAAKDGVDADKALRAIRAVLGSFEPKHEHKKAACAYMLSEWFDHVPQPAA